MVEFVESLEFRQGGVTRFCCDAIVSLEATGLNLKWVLMGS